MKLVCSFELGLLLSVSFFLAAWSTGPQYSYSLRNRDSERKTQIAQLLLDETLCLVAKPRDFHLPPAQQLAAIGLTTALPQPLQQALEPRDDFQPVPEPEPSNWLANYTELGQTFDQFTRSLPNRPDNRPSKLYLQPLGRCSKSDVPSLDQLRRFTAAFFMIEVVVLPPSDLAPNHIMSRRNPWTGQKFRGEGLYFGGATLC